MSNKLNDNKLTKNDHKDSKSFAVLIKERRYMISYLPDGIYVDLMTVSNVRLQLQSGLTGVQNGNKLFV